MYESIAKGALYGFALGGFGMFAYFSFNIMKSLFETLKNVRDFNYGLSEVWERLGDLEEEIVEIRCKKSK